ncbi:MAG TPA: hypothetical protein VK854_11660, partial [Woeseiaceae bacterium]|nr:hypothetical protein [Woeseiaceae bacterium]
HSAPRQVSTLLFRALSHAMLDQPTPARQTYDELMELYSNFDFERFAAHLPIAHPDPLKRYRDAVSRLRKIAGA